MHNGVMLQYFHWYLPKNFLWKDVASKAAWLKHIGITAVWLPPAYKSASGDNSVGYDTYDLYDLGEFDQKGSVATKYGSRDEYLQAVKALHDHHVQLIVDVVLNHKAGGDEAEPVMAIKVHQENRNEVVAEPEEIEAFTRFSFPGREGKYSVFQWDHQCFTGVDYNHRTGETAIFSFLSEYGNDWEELVGEEKGNYDYLMFADIEYRNPAVRQELKDWALWYLHEVNYDGVRLDAVKHMSPRFINEWIDTIRIAAGRDIFAVGEYWAPFGLEELLRYLDAVEGRVSLFDAPLQQRFHEASLAGNAFDLSTIFSGSLVQQAPLSAVTLVDNHDTQPLQALEAPVEKWFKPLAYALILLRKDGYPCIFYPDLFGCSYKDHGDDGQEYEIFLDKINELEGLLWARHHVAYGEQHDYFDHPNCIGWVRTGDEFHVGCAVVMSNGDAGMKRMNIGNQNAGKAFRDALMNIDHNIVVNEEGWAEFICAPGSVSVWVEA
ncbi:MAG: alpha-amylase [Chitinophagaceae bacterium]